MEKRNNVKITHTLCILKNEERYEGNNIDGWKKN